MLTSYTIKINVNSYLTGSEYNYHRYNYNNITPVLYTIQVIHKRENHFNYKCFIIYISLLSMFVPILMPNGNINFDLISIPTVSPAPPFAVGPAQGNAGTELQGGPRCGTSDIYV